jgi:integrase/recombinase XerD
LYRYFTSSPTQLSSDVKTPHGETCGMNSFTDETCLTTLVEAFTVDRRSRNLTAKTIEFYESLLNAFVKWCGAMAINGVDQITPDTMRLYMVRLGEEGHSAGGVHASYRTVRAFLRWYELEFEPAAWRNPLRNVKPPRVDVEPLEPVSIEHVRMMIGTCNRGKFTDFRDKALILFMLDTGVRAGELLALDRQDVDINGGVLIRQSKNRKPRTVFLGRESRRALRSYLKRREDNAPAMFIADDGERLRESGLRQILIRRAKRAGVPVPSCHSFRRAFALAMKRGGADLITLQRLLGHSDLSQLNRYLKQDAEDLRDAHNRASPADAI